jgi:hypothetical protein
MDPTSTGPITEFAIVVAGFTGLVHAIGSRDGAANPLVKLRTVTMLLYAFTAAFGSLLPTLGQSLEVIDIWRFSAFGLTALLIANMAATLISSRVLLTIEERSQLSSWMWGLAMVGNSVFSILLLISLFGGLGVIGEGAFFGALIWQLVLSAVLFTRLILQG